MEQKLHTKKHQEEGFCDCQFYTPILNVLNYVFELSKTKTQRNIDESCK